MAPSNPGQFEAFTTKPAQPSKGPTPDPRTQARDFIARYLGKGTGNAQEQVGGLVDDEVAQIVAAGAASPRDPQAARQQIKDVLTRAYDRRRQEHEAALKESNTKDTKDAKEGEDSEPTTEGQTTEDSEAPPADAPPADATPGDETPPLVE